MCLIPQSDGVLNRLQAMMSGNGPPGPKSSGGNSFGSSGSVRQCTGIGRDDPVGAVDDELVRREVELVALRHADAEEPQSGESGRKMLNSLDTSSIGPLWHMAHSPLVEPGVMGTLSNIARPRFSRGRDAIRKPRRRPSVGEEEQRQRREEARRRSLELCDELELQRRRLEPVLRRARERHRAPAPSSVVSRPSYMKTGCSDGVLRGRRRTAKKVTLVAAGSFASLTREGSGISMRTVACSVIRDVPKTPSSRPSPTNRGSLGFCASRFCASFGRERAGLDAVARDAGPAVALERLFVEEAAALFEPLHQAREPGRAVKLFGIAVKGDVLRLLRAAALRFGLQDHLAHEDR